MISELSAALAAAVPPPPGMGNAEPTVAESLLPAPSPEGEHAGMSTEPKTANATCAARRRTRNEKGLIIGDSLKVNDAI